MKKYGIIAVVLVIAISTSFSGCNTPQSSNLINEIIVVAAGDYYDIPFSVDTSEMQNVRVVGYFAASGGTGNDIEVAILDDMTFTNWINGHQGTSLYNSGKIMAVEIDVSITTSGKYHLVFSNTFSIVSSKTVSSRIDLNWSR